MSGAIQVAKKIKIFTGTSGLNTKYDPARIKFDPKRGIDDLAACKNIDIDETGRLSRRKGYTEKTAAAFHSIFCDGGECLFVSGVTLGRLLPDLETGVAVATVTYGARMRYAQMNNRIYYCNGYETGFVENGSNNAWEMGTYYGPETDRQFSGPPIGTDIGYYNLRMYVAQGEVCWYSEPAGINLFDLEGNYWRTGSRILMIRPVRDGIFIGTENGVFFYFGPNPINAEVNKVTDDPPVQYSDCKVYGTAYVSKTGKILIDQRSGNLAGVWEGSKGIYFGNPDGTLFNLIEDKVDYPAALTGAGVVYNNQYIGILDP